MNSSNRIRLVLIGGGGHAKVVVDCAQSQGMEIIGFLDDRADAPLGRCGIEHLGTIESWIEHFTSNRDVERVSLFNAIGANQDRQRTTDLIEAKLGPGADDRFAAIVHASAVVSTSAQIEPGVLVGPGAIVNADARIGRGTIINSGAIVEHDCVVGDFAHVAPGVALGGYVRIGAGALVGIGARVLPAINIGENAIVAGGAVVIADVAPKTTVRGVPARG